MLQFLRQLILKRRNIFKCIQLKTSICEKMIEFKDILNKLSRLLKLSGLKLLDKNFQQTRLSHLTGLINLYSHLGSWYFVYFVWPNTELIVKSLSVYGVLCHLLVKYLTLITGHERLQKILKKVLALHQYHAKGPFERMQPQLWCMTLVNRIFNFIMILYFGTTGVFLLAPIFILYFNDHLMLPYCFVLPFVDYTTLIGFSINCILQACFLYTNVLLESIFDILMVIFIIHTITFVDHFKMDLDEFGDYLTGERSKEPKEVKKRFKRIHQSHLEIIE